MKAVILAGGLGTRISEETISKPKPMIEIGGKPIIWHIMKHISNCGIKEFIVCLGYKGNLIKEYFKNFDFYNEDIKVDLKSGKIIGNKKKISRGLESSPCRYWSKYNDRRKIKKG